MGIAILLMPKKESRFKLAKILWLLAAYAFLHSVGDFATIISDIKEETKNHIGIIFTSVSYLFLFEFGRRLINLSKKILPWWLLPVCVLITFSASFFSSDYLKSFNIFVGYFVRFPAGIMASIGFILYFSSIKSEVKESKVVKTYFIVISIAMFLWAILCGIVRVEGNFFPANIINTTTFFDFTGFPVQVFRTITSILTTIALFGIFDIFKWEMIHRLQDSQNEIREYNNSLEEIVKQRTEKLIKVNDIQSSLYDVLQMTLQKQTLNEILEKILNKLLSVSWLSLEAKGAIFLVAENQQELVLKVSKNLNELQLNICAIVPFGRCLCGRAALNREIVFSQHLDETHENTYNGITPHGHYCIPIINDETVLGVINVYLKDGYVSKKEDEEFLRVFASLGAKIIIHYKSDEEIRALTSELEMRVEERTEQLAVINKNLFLEIEEHKETENLLLESNERYETLIKTSLDGFWVVNTEGRILEVNDAYCLMLGCSREKLLTKHITDIEVIESEEKTREHIEKIIKQGWDRFKTKHRCADGKIIDVEISTVFISSQKIFLVFINDITQRKQAEKELIKLNKAVESSSEIIFMTDKDGVITFINNEFTVVYGYRADEVVGKVTPRILKSGMMETKDYEAFWQAIMNKQVIKGDLINKTKNGKLIHIEGSANAVFDESGDIIGFLAIQRDITERKKIEEDRANAKKTAEDANRMKSEFLANMSHEIRTPLNAIIGFSNILKEKTAGKLIYTEYLDNIIQSSRVLLSLINDILDLSKVEAGKMVIDYQPVSLKNIIKEIHSVFQLKAKEKGLLLNIQILDDIPESIITDEKYLKQILFNLIGNAVKFTHKGSVDIAVNIIPKDNTKGSKADLKFTIKDTGIGIPSDKLISIFEPFLQIEHKDSHKYGGTGLGLSITKRLVELLGGTISVESQIGKGSVFSFSIFNIEISSLRIDENKNNENKLFSKIRFKNPVLLLAEDILSNRMVVKGYLESLKIIIIEAENGEECLNAIRKQRPDIILMDMQMPVMDGYTAINIIKSDDALKDIPIIALSASGMKQQKEQFEKVADDFLIKPIYKNELLEKLIKYLPYEELTENIKEHEKHLTEKPVVLKQIKLSAKVKEEIVAKFMPSITKLQEALNIDELQDFVKKLEKFNVKNKIAFIDEHCNNIIKNIISFNIEKILDNLKQLKEFINK
ncbi:MAG: hypothetical protein A2X08_03075 [Bacteroidetes bacterium GWA2_32_17]|nr:MAG: hypothetical protein A2X08_03075 [Bacteroidetes bacterium GWA2_32_17]